MNADNHSILIQQLVDVLKGGNAHATLEDALSNIPFELLGKKPHNLPYSIWQLTEHIRIAQWDILDFSRNANYKELEWPKDYWPESTAPKDEAEWQQCVDQIFKDREEFIHLLQDPTEDIYKPFIHGNGQNLLREALLIADHNSYHTAEIIVIRRLLNAWK
ncbi:MAG: DinB family protein [Ilyomonas sp.]